MVDIDRKKLGATPGKLALVGILGCVLVLTIVTQWPRKRGGAAGAVAAQERRNQPGPRPDRLPFRGTGAPSADEPSAPSALPAWPSRSLDQALAYNPFTPLSVGGPERAGRSQPRGSAAALADGTSSTDQAEEPTPPPAIVTQKVAVVAIGVDGPIATVGPHMLRLGDVVDGLIVTKIDEEGVVLVDKRERDAGAEDLLPDSFDE